jgi:hypothetical protein
LPQKISSSKLTFNPSTGILTATGFSGPLTGNVTGNCSGTATNTTNTAITNDTTTAATMYPTWVTANTGNMPQKVSSSKLFFVPSTGILTATGFSGSLTGNVTGNCSGSSGSCTGNAATASSLLTDYKARAYRNVAYGVTKNQYNDVQLDTENYDPGNDFGSYYYSVPVTGYYHISGGILLSSNATESGSGYAFVGIRTYENGHTGASLKTRGNEVKLLAPSTAYGLQVSDILYLTAGQELWLTTYSNGLSSNPVIEGNSENSYLAVHLLST